MSRSTARHDEVLKPSYEEFQREHRSLEQRLERLSRPRSRSPEEEAEIQRIKKMKLAIKDQMIAMQPH